MKPYIVIVHKDEHSAYGMSFPDAPGCFSAADEIDDHFRHGQRGAGALAGGGWREAGLPIPLSRAIFASAIASPNGSEGLAERNS